LTVIKEHHKDKRWRRHFECVCVCGNTKIVQGTLLKSGNTKSCGCIGKETARLRALPHGEAAMRQVIAGYKCKAKKQGIAFSLTAPQFKQIVAQPCFYCGDINTNIHHSPHGTGDFAYNGLDKIDPKKGYTFNNVVSCCKKCNFMKSNLSQGEFIRWIKRAYLYLSKTAMANQWG
jgi:hypothetical protein